MPRYFFDFEDDVVHRDEVGTKCADVTSACREATLSLSEMAYFAVPSEGSSHTFSVTVRNESGGIVYSATMSCTDRRAKVAGVS